MRRTTLKFVALTLVGLLVLAGGGFLLWMSSGVFNVAATQPHTRVGRWVLSTIMENSVRRHAADIRAPALSDPSLLQAGRHHYDEMCLTCHGAPGIERSEIGTGLRPEPPSLHEQVAEWSDAELYWTVKHGIRMSGMPAFGATHDERELWGIVAFLKRLPELSPGEYAALAGEGGESGGGNGHHAAEGEGHSH